MDGSDKDRPKDVQSTPDLAQDRSEWRNRIHVADPKRTGLDDDDDDDDKCQQCDFYFSTHPYFLQII